jgi:Partial alpha/beta-hydrolase lipase region
MQLVAGICAVALLVASIAEACDDSLLKSVQGKWYTYLSCTLLVAYFRCCVADLVLPFGYPLEQHFVNTKDDYILRIFRIPHGMESSLKASGRYSCPRNASSSPCHIAHHSAGEPSASTATACTTGFQCFLAPKWAKQVPCFYSC